jgi:hypothetical protein
MERSETKSPGAILNSGGNATLARRAHAKEGVRNPGILIPGLPSGLRLLF